MTQTVVSVAFSSSDASATKQEAQEFPTGLVYAFLPISGVYGLPFELQVGWYAVLLLSPCSPLHYVNACNLIVMTMPDACILPIVWIMDPIEQLL